MTIYLSVMSGAAALILAGAMSGEAPAQGKPAGLQLPKEVAEQVSGLIYACRKAGQSLVPPAAYLKSADIDGDGKIDHVVDVSRGCDANKVVHCGPNGCAINVHLSSKGGTTVALRGTDSAIDVSGGQTRVEIVRAGSDCVANPASAQCRERLTYQNGALTIERN